MNARDDSSKVVWQRRRFPGIIGLAMVKLAWVGLVTGFAVILSGCGPEQVAHPPSGAQSSRFTKPPEQHLPSELDPVSPPKAGTDAQREPGASDFGHADVSVTGYFRADDGSTAEVAGVCKISEDTVDCWKMDGSRNKELAAFLKKSIDEGKSRIPADLDFSLRFNRKNRIVVAKVQQAMGTRSVLDVTGAGSIHSAANALRISLPVDNPVGPRMPWSHYEVRMAVEDKGARSTVLRLSQSSLTSPGGAVVPCLDRTMVSLGGFVFQVQSIAEEPRAFQPGADSPRWTIRLKTIQSAGNMEVNVIPCDTEERPITYVDASGNPVTAEAFLKEKARVRGTDEPLKYRLVENGMKQFEGAVELKTNVNPAKVYRLRVVGRQIRRIYLTGIPLDPK